MSENGDRPEQVLDLDAIGAARRAARGEAPHVKLGGKLFALPVEIAFSVIEDITALDKAPDKERVAATKAAAVRLFGEEQLAEMMELGLTLEDVTIVVLALPKLYGVKQGESSASREQSEPTSEPSRPTSNASTE